MRENMNENSLGTIQSLRAIKKSVQEAKAKLLADDTPIPDNVRVLMNALTSYDKELDKRDRSMQEAIASLVNNISQTSKALSETGMRLEGILEAAKDVAFVFISAGEECNETCKIIEFSQGAIELFGYERKEALGLSPAELFAVEPPDKDHMPAGDRWTLKRKSGEYFPALLSIYPLVNPQGDSVARVIIAQDLSRQEQAEQLFKDAHEKYEALALVAPISIMAFDADGIITFVNKWHMHVYDNGRIQPELYLGKNISKIPSLLRSGVSETIKKTLKGVSVSLEDVHVPQFGNHKERWQNIRSSPIMEGKNVKGGIIIREEVTRRKQTELYLKGLVDSSPIPLLKVRRTEKGQIIRTLNPQAMAVLGPDAAGKPLNNFITPLEKKEGELSGMHDEQCEMQTVNGPRQAVHSVASMGGHHEIHAFMDVSELTMAKKMAEEANQAKTDFLSNISHEIRTPLNVLLGMLQMFQDADLGEELNEMAEYAAGAGQSLLTLLNDILDFSVLESSGVCLNCQKFNVHDIVNLVAIPYRVQAQEKGLTLTVSIDDDVPETLVGDPRRIRQSIFHLIGNSVKFTDEGSVQVHVKHAGPGSSEGRCKISFLISDTGIGIDKEKMSIIFEPFRQGDGSRTRRHGGTGIGLALVHEFAKAMGGSIVFSSRLDKGTDALLTVDVGMA